MASTHKKTYNHSIILVVIIVFSVLASQLFFAYLFLRGHSVSQIEAFAIGIGLCFLFAAIGQHVSQVNHIGRGILMVALTSSYLNYAFFTDNIAIEQIVTPLTGVVFFSYIGSLAVWDIGEDAWKKLTQREINTKYVVIIFASSIGILGLLFMIVFSAPLVTFFDAHPWVVALITGALGLIGGVILRGRPKKSKND